MAGFITEDGAHYLLNLMSGGETALERYYLALITGQSPGIAAYGTELDEPDDLGYQRAAYENISGNWVVTNGVIQNAYEIAFVTPSISWGYLQHWALCEAVDGGRVFAAGDLDPYQPQIAENLYFPVGGLSIEFSLTSWTALT